MSELRFSTIPDVVECAPIDLTWEGGTPPYKVIIAPPEVVRLPPGAVNKQPLVPITQYQNFTWTPAFPGGTKGDITIEDADEQKIMAEYVVTGSTNARCLRGVTYEIDSSTSTSMAPKSIPSVVDSTALTGSSSQAVHSTPATEPSSLDGTASGTAIVSSSAIDLAPSTIPSTTPSVPPVLSTSSTLSYPTRSLTHPTPTPLDMNQQHAGKAISAGAVIGIIMGVLIASATIIAPLIRYIRVRRAKPLAVSPWTSIVVHQTNSSPTRERTHQFSEVATGARASTPLSVTSQASHTDHHCSSVTHRARAVSLTQFFSTSLRSTPPVEHQSVDRHERVHRTWPRPLKPSMGLAATTLFDQQEERTTGQHLGGIRYMGRRIETDGGIRLAGGRPGGRFEEDLAGNDVHYLTDISLPMLHSSLCIKYLGWRETYVSIMVICVAPNCMSMTIVGGTANCGEVWGVGWGYDVVRMSMLACGGPSALQAVRLDSTRLDYLGAHAALFSSTFVSESQSISPSTSRELVDQAETSVFPAGTVSWTEHIGDTGGTGAMDDMHVLYHEAVESPPTSMFRDRRLDVSVTFDNLGLPLPIDSGNRRRSAIGEIYLQNHIQNTAIINNDGNTETVDVASDEQDSCDTDSRGAGKSELTPVNILASHHDIGHNLWSFPFPASFENKAHTS
ncbi:hypothetical protein C8Q74DRAFT_1392674 [Fomes fomentarius]|nr:hypothetical protein C8Q74DRAFT_1392674 [Fomes fomentarius]